LQSFTSMLESEDIPLRRAALAEVGHREAAPSRPRSRLEEGRGGDAESAKLASSSSEQPRRPVLFQVRPDLRVAAPASLVLLLAGWGAGEICRSLLQAADLRAVEGFAALRCEPLTWMASALSLGGSLLLIAPLGAFGCAALWRGGEFRAALLIALSTIGAMLIFSAEKLLVARPRPPVEQLVAAAHSSFPSGHAAVSAAFYLALLLIFLARRPRRALGVAGAAATTLLVVGIALSRVYLGVHYPTDVAAGMLLGGLWALLMALSLRNRDGGVPRPGG
jgi:membrane-associated phospholipid phosphatase